MARIDKGALTKLEIITEATKQFLEKGYTNTSANAVAKALGMSQGNLTFHFPTKEHLLAILVDMLCDFQWKRMEQEANEGYSSIMAICLELTALASACEGDYVLRFMTSHPKDASRKLIDVMAASKHIAHQFHLPMQSGSDAILSAMNRHYDTARYLDIVDYMREKMPEVTLTSDIIVGFPGETEADFEGTLAMLERVKFDMLYSFIYSPRKGTPAAEMEQIPKEIKSARFERLLAVQNAIALEKNQPLVGKTLRVLCDGVSKSNPALYSGRTEGNKIAFFEGTPDDTGKFVTFVPERADAFALYGKKIGSATVND